MPGAYAALFGWAGALAQALVAVAAVATHVGWRLAAGERAPVRGLEEYASDAAKQLVGALVAQQLVRLSARGFAALTGLSAPLWFVAVALGDCSLGLAFQTWALWYFKGLQRPRTWAAGALATGDYLERGVWSPWRFASQTCAWVLVVSGSELSVFAALLTLVLLVAGPRSALRAASAWAAGWGRGWSFALCACAFPYAVALARVTVSDVFLKRRYVDLLPLHELQEGLLWRAEPA